MSKIMYVKDALEDIATKVVLCGVVVMMALVAIAIAVPSAVTVCPVIAFFVMAACLVVLAVKEAIDLIVSMKGGEAEVERQLAE